MEEDCGCQNDAFRRAVKVEGQYELFQVKWIHCFFKHLPFNKYQDLILSRKTWREKMHAGEK